MFQGFVDLGSTFRGIFGVTNPSDSPVNADALPTFRVYGPGGTLISKGTAATIDKATITGTNSSGLIVVTAVAHGWETGDRVTITGVVGNTNANANWTITKVSDDTFSLQGSVANAAYVSGGIAHLTGMYEIVVAASQASGFESGQTYTIRVTSNISGVTVLDLITFTVT